MEGLGSDTGEVAVVEPPGAGAGASEVALDTGGVVIEETARPGRDGAVEIAVTWRETILLSVGGVTGLLVVILALLSDGKPWTGSCKMAFRKLSSAGVRSCGGKSGERLRAADRRVLNIGILGRLKESIHQVSDKLIFLSLIHI